MVCKPCFRAACGTPVNSPLVFAIEFTFKIQPRRIAICKRKITYLPAIGTIHGRRILEIIPAGSLFQLQIIRAQLYVLVFLVMKYFFFFHF